MNDEPRGNYFLARYYALAGDRAEALRHLRRSSELGLAYVDEPEAFPSSRHGEVADNPDLASLHGDPEFEAILAEVGQRELAAARQAVADEPESWPNHYYLADILTNLGKWEESVDAYGRSCELSGIQDPCAHYAHALYRVGREAEAREAARQASGMNDEPRSNYFLARYYALAGDRAEALRLLKRSLELGNAGEGIIDDPGLASLQGDPEFEAIVAEVKKRFGKE